VSRGFHNSTALSPEIKEETSVAAEEAGRDEVDGAACSAFGFGNVRDITLAAP